MSVRKMLILYLILKACLNLFPFNQREFSHTLNQVFQPANPLPPPLKNKNKYSPIFTAKTYKFH